MLVLTLCVPSAFANQDDFIPKIQISSEQVENYKSKGLSDERISQLTLNDIEILDTIDKGNIIGFSEKYLEIIVDHENEKTEKKEVTREEAYKKAAEYKKMKQMQKTQSPNADNGIDLNSEVGRNEVVTPSWMRLTVWIVHWGNKEYTLYNGFEWLSDPAVTLTDVIGLTHEGDVSINQNTEMLTYRYDRYISDPSNIVDTRTKYYFTAHQKNNDGYAFKFDILGSDSGYGVTNNRGHMQYDAVAKPSNFVGQTGAFGHYSHQILTSTISIGIGKGSMSVTPGFAFTDAIDCHANFTIQ